MVECCFCGALTEPNNREVHGWDVVRAGGGANHIVGRVETGRYACNGCIVDIRNDIPPGSPKLF